MDELIGKLKNWFMDHSKVAIAFSGGVDSCLVVYLSRYFLGRENVIAVISNSASLKSRDLETARKFCQTYDVYLEEIDAREIEDPNYVINPVNRCYFCKSALYSMMDSMVAGKYPHHSILNGNNLTDQGDYRPGLEAAAEHRVKSPLAECGLEKSDVRALAKYFNLFTWDKPASPCLSSRFPYGETITLNKLRMVEDAENILNDFGYEDVRVRHYGKTAKIEVPANRIDRIKKHFGQIEPLILGIGFDQCTIDEEGLVSGKLNREIVYVRQDQY
ncbi:MAG: ATP-dependent sacrificial sulfur transferase LarE [Cyclobacteriaceae bacterium]|nr:ATP-dependent sacrificial sulfur transferase LarE [Cyclobacteriaceae bacterium]